VQLVDRVHERQITLAGRFVQTVHGSSMDVEQRVQPAHTSWMGSVNHLPGLSNPALVSPRSKKSISSACCPIFVCSGPRSTGSCPALAKAKNPNHALIQPIQFCRAASIT